jgi:hypothetical protein
MLNDAGSLALSTWRDCGFEPSRAAVRVNYPPAADR